MFDKVANLFIIVFFFSEIIHLVNSQCPPDFVLNPCSCKSSIPSHTNILFKNPNPETNIIQRKSIACEHIHNSSFDLQLVFLTLSSFNNLISNQTANVSNFDSFYLYNTTVKELPENVFINITFKSLMFQDNFQLTTIDRNAFSYFKNHVELFETLNTNLSDAKTIFSIIKEFQNLSHLSMHNDRLKFIPNYAFNHKHLTNIFFGLEYSDKYQPIESIGNYAFYNLPNLQFLRIFSPILSRISKYAFALRNRSILNNGVSNMLELYLGGEMIESTSFEITSLSRFRNRFVFIRFYNTSITYLDEDIFQPFLESNPSSLLDINPTNTLFKCDCRSAWIQYDYFKNVYPMDNRVYGYPCWDHDFTKNCTINK
ncbi:unnamed protein product [Rotaria socialis]|uniref:Uncharacterized protein n=1 Tax=Rotaria socialis TaxID=392032 RepID=A0A817VIH7_9BILA|nr:unnamed protein product [Rotaria socialis]CAF3342288.1 unnamed protein product [Rotaria socialis]CAF3602049.1 unnamed protein product [Rotaria socialis]CAF4184768.1 unnamed protein product [Rotaria socialis]CAF4232715.1 unnamed protein product [Rotaria socialis]